MRDLQLLIEQLPIWIQMAILFGVAALIATFVVLIAFAVIRGAARRTDSFTLDATAKRLRSDAFWLLTFLLTSIFWNGLRIEPTEEIANPFYLVPAIKITTVLIYIFVGLFLVHAVGVAADTIRHRYNIDNVNNLRERKILTQLQYIQRIAGIVIFIVIASLALLQFESVRSLGAGLLTSAGVGGIIIGFAAQKSIANLLAGFQIAFTQPIRLDDALIVNGEYGWVEEITLTYVTMRLWDQRRQIVPLQKFIDDTFQNWTRTNSELIGTVFLYVDYTFPVPELRKEVERFLPTQELWDGRVQSVAVTDNNDKVMTLRILCSAKNAGETFNLRCALREHVIDWAQANYRDSLPRTRVDGLPGLRERA